ncbi:hypothetical protein ACO0LF_04965 [Undibacterium sp. Di27W]|uniref:hypothetical protein n=1 Tax=Undibacterium sp. Di27W TaxID=3413036 RepID=UPI003BF05906
MNSFNSKLIAIVLALVLPLSTGLAHAGGRPSGSSGGFRGGFSSQKNVSKPAPAQPSNTGFGSFNTSKSANVGKKSDSALNRDLEKNQAQANAQKSMDARQQAAQPGQRIQDKGFGSSNTGNGINNQAANQSVLTPPPVTQSAPPMMQPQVTQRGSGILPAVVGGVILGSVMSHTQAAENHRPQQLEPLSNKEGGNSKDAATDSDAKAADDKTVVLNNATAESTAAAATTIAAKEGSGFKVMRTALVLLLFATLAWAGWQFLRSRRNRQDSAVHYSLGGN